MKVGLGLYRHMLSRDYYDFARQAGCTHTVIHLVDYFRQSSTNPVTINRLAANTSRGEWQETLIASGRRASY